ncbi:MAG: hypothetical protein A2Z47_12445 [Thermodesulfovibrio sp. RBG_19FT_COMBO_42_12]|nr:MAG: hypothetical protein A2Z47_12445 [Thermodesulfovibrio sp. RBG_19FT_COMBO_42_12]
MKEKHIELKEKLRRENDEYLLLEEKHDKLEREIRSLNRKHVLTPEDEVIRKNLQKEKLLAKDMMMKIFREEENRQKKGKGK